MKNKVDRREDFRQRRAIELATPEQRQALEEFRDRCQRERKEGFAIECKRDNQKLPQLRQH